MWYSCIFYSVSIHFKLNGMRLYEISHTKQKYFEFSSKKKTESVENTDWYSRITKYILSVYAALVVASGRGAARGTGSYQFRHCCLQVFNNSLRNCALSWIKNYKIQCAVRGCTTKRGRKEIVHIHRFPKRGDARQRWIEACANSYLSRLEYRQVVERKCFFIIKTKSSLPISVFIFSAISQILETKFYVL